MGFFMACIFFFLFEIKKSKYTHYKESQDTRKRKPKVTFIIQPSETPTTNMWQDVFLDFFSSYVGIKYIFLKKQDHTVTPIVKDHDLFQP